MKKIKFFNKSILLLLLFGVASIGMVFSATLKNNPVNTSPNTYGDPFLTGTTFSVANDNSQTDKDYFKLSEIIFARPIAKLEMGSTYQEYSGEWDHTKGGVNPYYAILSNPVVVGHAAKQDDVNRLICQMPSVGETIFKIKVSSFKASSFFSMYMKIEEVSGEGDAELLISVNGKNIEYSEQYVTSGSTIIWQPYTSVVNASELEIELKLKGGSGAVLAFSDLYMYGNVDLLSVSASHKSVGLGTPVTLNAFSANDIDFENVKWEKNLNGVDFVALKDESGTQLTGATIKDRPEAGETCYRAVALIDGAEVYSNEVCVSAEYKCASNSAQHNLFIEDFGTLSSETSRSAGSVEYINTAIYRFVGDCKPLKDEGTYALMTNPRFAGYGDLGNDGNSCTPDMNNLWFRDLYDHTSGGFKNGEWGAMLMVNAANLQGQSEQKVYSRTVDMPCTNTNMIFSAWFANASNPDRVSTKVSMKFVVRDENGQIIDAATLPVNEIKPNDGWVKGETSFNSGNNNKLTVEIYNCMEGGDGNDFMVDDISFSICVPEVSLSVSSILPEVQVKDDQVSGSCGSDIILDLEEGMAEVVFGKPYYLWYVKEQGSSEFVRKEEFDSLTLINTKITPYTQYYVVATANKAEALDYIEGKLSKCAPVAVSNTITVLCAPNLEVSVKERNCNEVTLEAKKYDDPSNLIDFWWQISKDGKNWSNINVPKNTYKLEDYVITSDSYFRIYTDLVASSPVKVSLRGISLTSQPAKTYIGSSVKLTASTINYELGEDDKYQWFEKDLTTGTSDYSPLEETTNSFIYYTLQSDKASIKVEADGCEAEVTIEKLLPIEIQEKSRDCNEITIEATTEVEPSKIKWYYSADGNEYIEYSQVGTPIVFDVPEENTDGVYIKGKTTDGKESDPIFVKPIIIKNSVYNAEGQQLNTEATLIVNEEESITIKTSITGWELSSTDLINYKSCDGRVLASTTETEFATSITNDNKCFVTEFKGCISEDIEFSIREKELIWPTAFNPLNQDGVNDTFVKGYGIKVKIIDRYGNVVAESEDGWDGTIKGKNAMPGVYFYVATLPDETVKKGTIELVHYVK